MQELELSIVRIMKWLELRAVAVIGLTTIPIYRRRQFGPTAVTVMFCVHSLTGLHDVRRTAKPSPLSGRGTRDCV